jgi:hypothetical protein
MRSSGAPLRLYRPFFGMLVALVMGLYVVAPAKDLPQTQYDESQKLPYSINSLHSVQMLQQSIRAPQSKLKLRTFDFFSVADTLLEHESALFSQRELSGRAPTDPSPTIRYHALRV